MPKWTEEQQLAIDKEGCNIIVSAGAGSGKTAVLSERVIRKLRSGVNIDNLLILTFTNKAAFEMKDRIRKKITEDQSIINQLDYIDSAYITTFDSFALSMVKKYSYLLNISKSVAVADSSTILLEKRKTLDDIFERLYKEENPRFLKLIGDFTVKKDDDIKEYILDIFDKLELKYDKKDYLDNYIESYYGNSNISLFEKEYLNLLEKKVKNINDLLIELSSYADSTFLEDLELSLTPLLNSKTYDEYKINCEVKMPRLPKNSEEETKTLKEKIKKEIENISSLARFEDSKELIDTLSSTKDYVTVIIDIIKELDEKIYNFKKNLNIYEFVDIEKLAIKILKENKNVALELRNSFNEIMIDEYQDTSDLQDMFVSLIENNNVYMVGDIKQSIYRFRNANPFLFKEKYENYSKNNGGFKIDLTKNFRSRSEVIDNINLIFSIIMSSEIGDADYKESHKMLFGNNDYLEEGKTNYSNDFELYNYEYDKNCGFTKEEIEIFFIAKDIKNKVENKYQVYDKDLKTLRDITYKDFAILLDKSTNFDLYKKIFQYFNVPLSKYTTTNLTEEIEIVLIKNILKLLIGRKDNNYDIEFKYAFVSIARSNLFEYSDQQIFDIVSSNDYTSSLLEKIDEIVENINSLSLKEIIYMIIDKFDFYNKVILLGDVKNRVNRITSIINIFDTLSSLSYDIIDAYNYLNELIEKEDKIEIKDLDLIPNSVTLMTIHGSKGLEYPICYFASMHSKFNLRELNEKFMYNNKYGIISPYFKEGIGKTFVKDLVKDLYYREEISEKVRLFYVALTRPREKFIIVTSMQEGKVISLKDARSFLDFLYYVQDSLTPYIKALDINSLNLTKDYNLIKKINYKDAIAPSNNVINTFQVDIKNSEIHKEKISKETHSLLDKDVKEKMKFGTKVHEVLELLDFKNPKYDNLGIDKFYIEKIKKFIEEINVDKAINIYKEYEFRYKKDDTFYNGIIDLIIEYSDKISIIDYKLKNVEDENYIKQLNSYKDYILSKTNKKIDIYLFSIINGTLKKLS